MNITGLSVPCLGILVYSTVYFSWTSRDRCWPWWSLTWVLAYINDCYEYMYRETWQRFVMSRLLLDFWGQKQWLWQTMCWNQAVLSSFGWLPGVQVPEGDVRDVMYWQLATLMLNNNEVSSIAWKIFQPSRVASSLAEWFRKFSARDARFKTEIHPVGELHGVRLWPFSQFQLQYMYIYIYTSLTAH